MRRSVLWHFRALDTLKHHETNQQHYDRREIKCGTSLVDQQRGYQVVVQQKEHKKQGKLLPYRDKFTPGKDVIFRMVELQDYNR
jgi:hypothetical protein